MVPFDVTPRTRVVYGPGCLSRLGALAVEIGLRRPLLVADRGLALAGHAARARGLLEAASLEVTVFEEFDQEIKAMVEKAAKEREEQRRNT